MLRQDGVAVVTGASRGLGAEVALGLARRGYRVALLARSGEHLRRVAGQVRELGGQAEAWPTDIRDWEQVHETIGDISRQWGRIDLLVNAAGIKREGPLERTPRQDVMEAMEVNFLGSWACCRAVIPVMRRHHGGHIINVSSVLGKRATPQRAAYSASKAALNAMTDSLRAELAGAGIRVTLVCPGRVAEPGVERKPWLSMNAAEAAERIVQCIDRAPRELVLTPAGKLLVFLNALAPGLVDRIAMYWRGREMRTERPIVPSVVATEQRLK